MKGHTTQPLTRHTRGGLPFILSPGTPVETRRVEAGTGTYTIWEVSPSALPPDSIERHDATYYGIEVPAEVIKVDAAPT